MAADQSQLEAAVGAVEEPEFGRTLGHLGLLRSVRPRRRRVEVEVALPVAAWPGLEDLADSVHRAARAVPGVEEVDLEFVVMTEDERNALRSRLRTDMLGSPTGESGHAHDGAAEASAHGHAHGHAAAALPAFLAADAKTRVIGVSSGKGGVGKSTVTVNLAVALAQAGHHVGLLDADVYGFSVPKMLGADHDPVILGDIVLPTSAHGVRCLSMGYFVPDDQPVIWRGPMLHKAVQQFLTDAYWGEPDFVLVDMPPGTGDAQLTMAQQVPLAGAVIVSTPQDIALLDARKGLNMFKKVDVPVLGIVENMSYFLCPHCGGRSEIFSHGGARQEALRLGTEFLGEVPLDIAIRETSDGGTPITIAEPDNPHALVFRGIAARIWEKVAGADAQRRPPPRIIIE